MFSNNRFKTNTITRINAGIPVQDLSRQHLIAEHREITRIPNAIKAGRFSMNGQPAEFKLGQGHVKFFYDKLGYLKGRYMSLYLECRRRGYNVTNKMDAFVGIDPQYMGHYTPTPEAISIVKQRIKERS